MSWKTVVLIVCVAIALSGAQITLYTKIFLSKFVFKFLSKICPFL